MLIVLNHMLVSHVGTILLTSFPACPTFYSKLILITSDSFIVESTSNRYSFSDLRMFHLSILNVLFIGDLYTNASLFFR
uniref:Uncharacterized protein n=1 Tax=Arion vulgaris TaxID=1028688 RepID=A0A0B7AK07_9EUPU